MVLVDTSIWIDYFNGVSSPKVSKLDFVLSVDRVIIGDLIIAELLQGFRTKKQYAQAKKIISLLEYRDMVGKNVAEKAAENYRILRSKGVTIRKTMDMLIGTFCVLNKIKLLHNDKDFNPMEKHLGLFVV